MNSLFTNKNKRSIRCLHAGDDFANLLIHSSENEPRKLIKFSIKVNATSASKNNALLLAATKDKKDCRSLSPEDRLSPASVQSESADAIQGALSAISLQKMHENKEYSNYRGQATSVFSLLPIVVSACVEAILPKSITKFFISPQNSALKKLEAIIPQYHVEVITDPSQKQIERTLPSPPIMVRETPSIYEKYSKPYIEKNATDKALAWVYACVNKEKESERLILDDEEFVLCVDTKWREHANCRTVKIDDWKDHEATNLNDLYCLAIVKQKGIKTIRDLTGKHIDMLKSIQSKGLAAIEDTYGVPADQIRVFFHYVPQFFHLHIHFTRLWNEIGAQTERAHLIEDVIDNLEVDSEYYQKKSITFKLPARDGLYVAISEGVEKEKKAKEEAEAVEEGRSE
jgi:m7GpppX diphosphatase